MFSDAAVAMREGFGWSAWVAGSELWLTCVVVVLLELTYRMRMSSGDCETAIGSVAL